MVVGKQRSEEPCLKHITNQRMKVMRVACRHMAMLVLNTVYRRSNVPPRSEG